MHPGEKLERLINESPTEALRYVNQFIENDFWQYCLLKVDREIKECEKELRKCDLNQVELVRTTITMLEDAKKFPDRVIDDIKDEIELQKEAAKLEDARKVEK